MSIRQWPLRNNISKHRAGTHNTTSGNCLSVLMAISTHACGTRHRGLSGPRDTARTKESPRRVWMLELRQQGALRARRSRHRNRPAATAPRISRVFPSPGDPGSGGTPGIPQDQGVAHSRPASRRQPASIRRRPPAFPSSNVLLSFRCATTSSPASATYQH